jgi:hypothetical protein
LSFSDRLRKLESAAEGIQEAANRCATCGSFVPSMDASLLLGPKGVYVNALPCPDCGPLGGGGSIPVSPVTGVPATAPYLVLLDMDFSDWWTMHGHRGYEGSVALSLHYHARLDGLINQADVSLPKNTMTAPAAFHPWLVHELVTAP